MVQHSGTMAHHNLASYEEYLNSHKPISLLSLHLNEDSGSASSHLSLTRPLRARRSCHAIKEIPTASHINNEDHCIEPAVVTLASRSQFKRQELRSAKHHWQQHEQDLKSYFGTATVWSSGKDI